MLTQTQIQNITKEAGLLVSAIEKGVIDTRRLKMFLSEVQQMGALPVKQNKRYQREALIRAAMR